MIWFRVVFFWCKSKCRLTKNVRFSTLFILLHLGLLQALAVTTATFALKAPTRPSRTLTGASFFGFVTGLPELCYKAFIYVGIYGRMFGNYENKDVWYVNWKIMTVVSILVILLLMLMKFEHSCGKIIYVCHSQDMKCQNSEQYRNLFIQVLFIGHLSWYFYIKNSKIYTESL